MLHDRATAAPALLRLGGRPVSAVGPVRIYVCGVTPYAVTHLGHASTFVWADTAARVLTWTGHKVDVARNVTDVDDVLYGEAARRGQEPTLFGAVQRASFELTMSALRVRTPDHQLTAAQAVGQVIRLAAILLAVGEAYERDGTVYARTASAAAGLDRDTALALSAEYRDEPDDPDKDDPLDVALLDRAGATLDRLYSAGGRPGGDQPSPRLRAALLDDLDIAAAIEIALDDGAATARALIGILMLG